MCLTIPAKIIKVNKNKARVDQGHQVNVSLLSEVKVGLAGNFRSNFYCSWPIFND